VSEALAWPLGLGVLGAILGSFVGALAVRWPRGGSVAHGRSACDGCGRTLAWWELVPLVSAAALRGRCRTCAAAIDPAQPLAEALAAAIGAAAGLVVPGPEALAGSVFGWLLLASALLDWRAFWLPDRLTAALALAGAASAFAFPPAPVDRAIGAAAGFATLWLVGAVYRLGRGREGLGGGDPKLAGAIGLWLGWRALPLLLLAASAVGLAAVLAARLAGRPVARDTRVPFGTLLALAAYPLWLLVVAGAP
jgi:leader peptidase (prepilin peptidase) / N-methyltransferase